MRKGEVQLFEYFLSPGYIYLSRDPSLISTVVGSGIAVALWDGSAGYGGMNAFLYPEAPGNAERTPLYGDVAVDFLIRMFLEEGSKKKHLKAQLFGGASSGERECTGIAMKNISKARQVLRLANVPVISEDTGGRMGRKIVFNTLKNEAIVYKVNTLRKGDWHPYIQDR
ncbi:MAG: chemotaxis protein CheD [Syntrophales bacterium]|jgi:chemotaxis protein CheD|nr:chemotaxis protein CheD [Syntrophales bacterium]